MQCGVFKLVGLQKKFSIKDNMRSHAEPGNEKLFYAGFGLEMLGIIAQPAFILTYALRAQCLALADVFFLLRLGLATLNVGSGPQLPFGFSLSLLNNTSMDGF